MAEVVVLRPRIGDGILCPCKPVNAQNDRESDPGPLRGPPAEEEKERVAEADLCEDIGENPPRDMRGFKRYVQEQLQIK